MKEFLQKFKWFLLGGVVTIGTTAGIAIAAPCFVNAGCTGQSNIPNNSILTGSSTNQSLNVIPVGANGTVLSAVSGVPTYVATSTLGFIGGGGSASGTAGSLQFSNGSGGFNADSLLQYNNTNHWLGIGTTSPAYALHVASGNALFQPDGTWSSGDSETVFLGDTNAYVQNNFTGGTVMQGAGQLTLQTVFSGNVVISPNSANSSTFYTGGDIGFGGVRYTFPSAMGNPGQFLGTTASGSTQSLSWLTPGYITVCSSGCDYTATGTNDQVGINSALSAASALPGGTVYVKASSSPYTISDNINIPSNVTLLGDGMGNTIIKAKNGYTPTPGPDGGKSMVVAASTTIANVTITGFTFDANGQNIGVTSTSTTNSNRAIDIYKATNLVFSYNEIKNPINYATFFYQNNQLWIDHNYITAGWDTTLTQQDGIHTDESNNFFITNNYVNTFGVGTSGDDAIAIQQIATSSPSSFGVVSDNVVGGGARGIGLFVNNGILSNIDVHDNVIFKANKTGIILNRANNTNGFVRNIAINNNHVFNIGISGTDGDGIRLEPDFGTATTTFIDISVQGNEIRGVPNASIIGGRGIAAIGKGNNLIISNNQLNDIEGTVGIQIGSSNNPITDIVCNGNKINTTNAASNSSAILLFSTQRSSCQSNQINGATSGTSYGFQLQADGSNGSSYNNISNNTINNVDNGVAEINVGANPDNNQFMGNVFSNIATNLIIIGSNSRSLNGSGANFGIGTTSTPSGLFTIQGNSGSNSDLFRVASSTNSIIFNITSNGKINIGNSGIAPDSSLTVMDNSNPTADINSPINYPLTLRDNIGSTGSSTGLSFAVSNSANSIGASIYHIREGSNSFGPLVFATRPNGGTVTERMRILANGTIAIGTSTPTASLQLQSQLSTTPIIISSSSGVTLMSLDQTGNLTVNSCTGCGTGTLTWVVGNGTLYNSTSTDAVLIGTSTPTNASLLIQGKSGKSPFIIASSTIGSQNMLTVAQTGAVGINISQPLALLHILHFEATKYDPNDGFGLSSSYPLLLQNNQGSTGSSTGIGFAVTGSADTVGGAIVFKRTAGSGAGELDFYTKNTAITQGMVLDTNQNLGIGSTSPIAKLSVQGTSGSTTPLFIVSSSTGSSTFQINSNGNVGISSTTPGYKLAVSGTVGLDALTTNGAAQTNTLCLSSTKEVVADTATCALSAARYKQNIKSLDIGLGTLMKLRPVSYYFKPSFNGALQSDPNLSGEQYGLIADEVQKVDPNLTIVTTNTTTFEGKIYPAGTIQGLQAPNTWIGLFVKSIQEQQKEIQNITVGKIKRSAEENWQWVVMGFLALGYVSNRRKISKLEKKFERG